jgi:peroxidase
MKGYQQWLRAVMVFIFMGTTLLTAEVEAKFPREFRTIDGTSNNLSHSEWGSANTELLRMIPPDYDDGISTPAGYDRKSAREISNTVCDQSEAGLFPNSLGVSDFVWQWGQFIDHDIDLTVPAEPPAENEFYIPVPDGDPYFTEDIPFIRSAYTASVPRQQINQITAFIDASNVYGSDPETAMMLRALDGTGRLLTSYGHNLPFVDPKYPSLGFVAGDVRVNEQIALTTMHTLFVREHNFWASIFGKLNHRFSDNDIYYRARALVGAEIQAITYNEFLPALLGHDALAPYDGYDSTVNPGISNVFSTAAYRFGHSMLSPVLQLLKRNGEPIVGGNIPLRDAFFNPEEFIDIGIEPILRGLASQMSQDLDIFVVDDVRNFLFGTPDAGGFDLAALNIQRGRDHGIASYNQVRKEYGLPQAASFADISENPIVQQRLQNAYNSVDDVDLWIGGLAEDHVEGSLLGETFRAVLIDQFQRLRNCDRFWYENYLPRIWVRIVKKQTLADIIRRNTKIRFREIQNNVFIVPKRRLKPRGISEISR